MQDNARLAVYSSCKLEFYGGGEQMAIHLANLFSRSGFDVEVIGNSSSGVPLRVPTKVVLKALHATYTTLPYVWFHKVFPNLLVQARPPISSLIKHEANLMFIHRLPEREYIKEITNKHIPTIFLLHGVTFEEPTLQIGLFLPYMLYLRLITLVNRRIYRSPYVYYQTVNTKTSSSGVCLVGIVLSIETAPA